MHFNKDMWLEPPFSHGLVPPFKMAWSAPVTYKFINAQLKKGITSYITKVFPIELFIPSDTNTPPVQYSPMCKMKTTLYKVHDGMIAIETTIQKRSNEVDVSIYMCLYCLQQWQSSNRIIGYQKPSAVIDWLDFSKYPIINLSCTFRTRKINNICYKQKPQNQKCSTIII